MSPVRIVTRTVKSGKRYVVYFRRGGRGYPDEYAGSFKTKKEAQTRRDTIAGELAAGRDPSVLLKLLKTPAPVPGLAATWDTWAASKRKVGDSAKKLYVNSKAWWVEILGAETLPAAVTVTAISAGLDEMLDELSASTVRLYLSHLAMMLDFALPDGTPNPARSKKIELPAAGSPRKPPPSSDEWTAITTKIAARSLLTVRLMECCALRVAEACGIESGDIDAAGGQVLIRRTITKTHAGRRWVPVPAVLLDQLAERGGAGVTPSNVYYDLRQACSHAKIAAFGTHAFRRRRISLWYAQQIDGPQIARWAGHAKPSESMDTYAFEVVDALTDEWLSFWQGTYRPRGAAPVRHEEVTE